MAPIILFLTSARHGEVIGPGRVEVGLDCLGSSLIEGLRRYWTNTPAGTRARRDPSLENTSAATLLFRGTC
jgi:hypothetical protein